MLRALIRAAVLIPLLTIAALSSAHAWKAPKADDRPAEEVKTVRWEGSTDIDMLKQVRGDLESATAKDSKIKVLRAYVTSPGGPVITSLEISRLIRKASDAGLIVEIHAEALCASGCTWLLASGTPGHRHIARTALFLVHPIQKGGGFGSSCATYTPDPKTEDDKIINALLDLMRDAYVRYTDRTREDAEDWLTCGHERVGGGDLAVSLGMADRVED